MRRLLAITSLLSLVACSSKHDTGTSPSDEVATVTVGGAARVKAGDEYQYTAQLRTASGETVTRPVTWSVVSGPATVSATGVLRATGSGTVVIRAAADGVVGTGVITAYDWQTITGAGTIQVALPADLAITNRFGQSEYPTLGVGCAGGTFLVYVGFLNFVTANGVVAYALDGSSPIGGTWIEGSSFDVLGHPGPTNAARKAFAATIGNARQFHFAFTEFNGSPKTTTFRVTGLTQALGPVLAACPSNALMERDATAPALADLLEHLARS